MRFRPWIWVFTTLSTASAMTLDGMWESLETSNKGLSALRERKAGYQQNTRAALASFAPSLRVEATAQHLNDDLVVDLEPIRQAMIQLQSADQVQFAKIQAAMAGKTLSDAQQKAYSDIAKHSYDSVLPPFRSVMKEQDHWLASATVVQPLFVGGKIWNSYQITQEQSKLGDSEFAKSKSELLRESGKLYIQRLLLDKSIALRNESVHLLQNYESRAKSLIQQGMVEPRILLQTQMNLEDTRAALAEDSAKAIALESVLADLCGQMGQPTDQLPEPKIPVGSPSEWADANQSPSVKLSQSQADLAQKISEIKMGDLLPEIAAFGRYELHPAALSALEPKWVVGVKASLPLKISDYYNYGASRAKTREAKFALEMQKGQTAAQANRYGILATSASKRYYASALRDSLGKENHRLARIKWEQGQNPEIDALEAAVQWHKSRLERLQMSADAWTSYLEWAALMGQIPKWLNDWKGASLESK